MKVAGIDVAHKSLAVVIASDGASGKAKTFANDAIGHGALIKELQRAHVERIVLEATGAYHVDLAVALDSAGLAVMVLNPKAARQFAEVLMTRNKTDAVDAKVLAEYALRMNFEPWVRPDDAALALRACARRLAGLVKARGQAKNQLHAASQSTTTPEVVLADLRLSIEQYERQIATLRAWADGHIAEHARLARIYQLLTSVKGIGAASAVQLMGELLVLPEDMQAKQWVAHAGLDPRQATSGTSVNKKPHLSKAGNAYLRQALYMPALSATRHDPGVRGFYRHLIETRGLKKIQAICAVMRKLLHAIHGMLRHQQPFDGSRFYRPAHTPA
jgi:transposase